MENIYIIPPMSIDCYCYSHHIVQGINLSSWVGERQSPRCNHKSEIWGTSDGYKISQLRQETLEVSTNWCQNGSKVTVTGSLKEIKSNINTQCSYFSALLQTFLLICVKVYGILSYILMLLSTKQWFSWLPKPHRCKYNSPNTPE